MGIIESPKQETKGYSFQTEREVMVQMKVEHLFLRLGRKMATPSQGECEWINLETQNFMVGF